MKSLFSNKTLLKPLSDIHNKYLRLISSFKLRGIPSIPCAGGVPYGTYLEMKYVIISCNISSLERRNEEVESKKVKCNSNFKQLYFLNNEISLKARSFYSKKTFFKCELLHQI